MNLKVNEPITKDNHYKIVFVCLGNICRSPTAEGVLQHLVNERELDSFFEIDSAGTSAYHEGESANRYSQQTANENGIQLHSKARQFKPFDLEYFDLIITMDNENYANATRLVTGNQEDKIMLLRDFDPKPEDRQVPDPYAGGRDGFKNVFQIVKRSCSNLLDQLEPHIQT